MIAKDGTFPFRACLRRFVRLALSFPKIPSAWIRAMRQNQAHHSARCLHSFCCLGRLSPTCSGRGAGLKSRTSFSGISSILLWGVHRTV